LFADDLTGFLKNDHSLIKFMGLVEAFGECSGLRINLDKSEVMILGNRGHCLLRNGIEIRNLKIKHSVKILGAHFTYDQRAKRKLNFDEIVTSVKQKLHIWRWRDLTIIGRIQIVETFIIPVFLYRASMICSDQEFVKELNKIIFEFIWRGKDKIKRSALIGDIRDGELKAPHLNSMIETQRIMCCKKLASDEPSSWKTVLLHNLKPVGGKLILGCSFEVKMLPLKLPPFYEDSLKNFAKCSVATNQCEELTENNELITKRKVRELNLTPLDLFRVVSVVNALPNEWRDLLKRSSHSDKRTFNPQDQIALSLNGQKTPINKAVSKTIYKELRNRVISTPSAQKK